MQLTALQLHPAMVPLLQRAWSLCMASLPRRRLRPPISSALLRTEINMLNRPI